MPGQLIVCSTPIGNLGDASDRLRETLASVDLIYAEDTRRSRTLLDAFGIKTPLRSFFVGNEKARAVELGEALLAGKRLAVITDAGTPAVSDPGAIAVAQARRVGASVTVIPGPSAVTTAVAASGMVDGSFVFDGFLARKGSERREQLAALKTQVRPTVMFLSPHRVAKDLAAIAETDPERTVFIGREMTKLHEEMWWGSASAAADRWSEGGRGEFTVVIDGARPPQMSEAHALDLARQYVEEGLSPSQAARRAAGESNADRRSIYERLIR